MKALRFEAGEPELADIDTPLLPFEAQIRVVMAGICNTDLEIVRGYADFNGTLGHEFVGVVEHSPQRSQVGRRVVGEINAGCGKCRDCLNGDPRHCPKRSVLGIHGRDGAFAEYLSLPASNLIEVPDVISDRQAVFVEPLAAACQILHQVELDNNDKVAVIGDGKLGQLIARVLAETGCELVLIGKHADKLELASNAGINTLMPADVKIDPDHRYDYVVEASGSPSGFKLALDLVRPRGTIVLKSTYHGALEFDASRVVVNEIRVIGSRCGRFENAINMLRDGKVNVDSLIVGEYNLEDGVEAMKEAAKPGTLKILLNISNR